MANEIKIFKTRETNFEKQLAEYEKKLGEALQDLEDKKLECLEAA